MFTFIDEILNFKLFIMKKITLLAALLVAFYSNAQIETSFETGEGFQPDFILMLKLSDNLFYIVFIEPKGMKKGENKSLFNDDWKEEFLKTIDSIHGINGQELYVKKKAYHLIGLPFYNSEHEGRFKEKFENIIS